MKSHPRVGVRVVDVFACTQVEVAPVAWRCTAEQFCSSRMCRSVLAHWPGKRALQADLPVERRINQRKRRGGGAPDHTGFLPVVVAAGFLSVAAVFPASAAVAFALQPGLEIHEVWRFQSSPGDPMGHLTSVRCYRAAGKFRKTSWGRAMGRTAVRQNHKTLNATWHRIHGQDATPMTSHPRRSHGRVTCRQPAASAACRRTQSCLAFLEAGP